MRLSLMWRLSAHMNDRPTEIRSSLPCPYCGRGLVPVPTGRDVVFHCKSGHGISLFDLLGVQSAVVNAGLHALLGEWNRQFKLLIDRSEDARKNGFLDIAEIYGRYAKSLFRRMEILQGAFTKSESSKLIAVPPAGGSREKFAGSP